MAAVAVTFDGTRLHDSDSNTGWGNYNVGGGSPASEPANAYQITTGTTTGAVGKKITSTTARQGVDYNGTSVNYAANNYMWYCKVYASDAFDLNTTWGVEVTMGSADTSNFHQYNIAGSGSNLSVYSTYPAQGGYLITCIDPTIDTWAEVADSGGTTDQTAIVWYAVGMQFQNGLSKAENVAMDAIDYGTGLTLVGGSGADTDGKYTDFVATDQDIRANRWGAAIGSGNNVVFRGIATIGGTATEFTDDTSVVVFPDGYHSAGMFGVAIDLTNAGTTITDGCLLIGEGTRNGVDANDTRPDYIVTGTSGADEFYGTLRNFRNVTFTSVCDVHDAIIECQLLTQASADIYNSVIRTNSLTSIACLQDPTFGSTTDLHDVEFIQSGAGHAIEIDTAGDYNFNNLTFTGYGADTTDSAAIDVTATTGTVNINVLGTGNTPTYKTAGATVNVIVGQVTFTLTVKDTSGAVIQGAMVYVEADTGGDLTAGTVIINKVITDVNGQVSDTRSYTSNQPITGRVRKSTTAPYYKTTAVVGTISSTAGLDLTVQMILDQ